MSHLSGPCLIKYLDVVSLATAINSHINVQKHDYDVAAILSFDY